MSTDNLPKWPSDTPTGTHRSAKGPATRSSLLVRIRDAEDEQAWRQFVDIYGPLVYRYARKHGLQDADAADLTQEVLRAVAKSVDRLEYDRERGSFRGWLFSVTRNTLCKFLARRKGQVRGTGGTAMKELLEEQPDGTAEDAAVWDREHEHRLFHWAARQVRDSFRKSTWQAFWQTAVEGKGAREVADMLGMSVGAAYIAKSRVLARVKMQIEQIHGRNP
jgi:RNA polymerase sigma factor (sigma-70 family)